MGRTDGDSWDLLSSVGATATAVAAQRAIMTSSPTPFINDPFAGPLLTALGAEHFLDMLRGSEGESARATAAMNSSIGIRTRYFDDFFLDATAAGIRQAVILAAGLDTRAYRLPWAPETPVFEIDQPDVIDFKTRTIEALGSAPGARHRPLGVDLRDDWPAALRAAGFDENQPTAWIAEGLLIYLPPTAQDALFDAIDALSAPGSRVGTENIAGMTEDQLDRISSRIAAMRGDDTHVDAVVDVADLWYIGERTKAGDYLAGKGWTAVAESTSELFGKYGLDQPAGMLTPFGDPVYLTARLA
jgi:methyltransferase (TIGR00027 family)